MGAGVVSRRVVMQRCVCIRMSVCYVTYLLSLSSSSVSSAYICVYYVYVCICGVDMCAYVFVGGLLCC